MNIKFSKWTHPTLFQALVRVAEHVSNKHQTRNEKEVLNLIQQECGVRFIRNENYDPDYNTTTKWIAHFAGEKAYTMFMVKWT